MAEKAIILLSAYILDLLFGDPGWLPHPVRGIGWVIDRLEKPFRIFIKRERVAGLIFAVSIIVFVYSLVFFMVQIAGKVNYVAGLFVSTLFIYSALSVKDLKIESMLVYSALKKKDLLKARQKLSLIVGRDTENLDESEIIRATVETIAENIVDGIIAPLFYAFIGGAPLALAYKAVSTLDSMVGYKNEKYKNFGWASARLDDIVNFIPARISGLILPFASWLVGKNTVDSWKITFRDGKKNPSPNSGIPEAAMAGALGIQLGGLNYYQGVAVEKPLIGDNKNYLRIEHIRESIKITYIGSLIVILIGILLTSYFSKR